MAQPPPEYLPEAVAAASPLEEQLYTAQLRTAYPKQSFEVFHRAPPTASARARARAHCPRPREPLPLIAPAVRARANPCPCRRLG